MPRERRRSSFSLRPWMRLGRRATLLDLGNLEVESAGGGGDLYLLPRLLPQQGSAHRGKVGYLALPGIGFGAAHNSIGLGLAVLGDHSDPGANLHPVGLAMLDDDGVLQDVLQFQDVALYQGLLILGLLILRIVVRAPRLLGPLDLLGHLEATHRAEVL